MKIRVSDRRQDGLAAEVVARDGQIIYGPRCWRDRDDLRSVFTPPFQTRWLAGLATLVTGKPAASVVEVTFVAVTRLLYPISGVPMGAPETSALIGELLPTMTAMSASPRP